MFNSINTICNFVLFSFLQKRNKYIDLKKKEKKKEKCTSTTNESNYIYKQG
jgi:hypothetical protein